jgi:hypothetical protein
MAKNKSDELKSYFSMLPDSSEIKHEFKKRLNANVNIQEIGSWLKDKLSMGSIDVNIMTKVDKENYKNGELLPSEYNDAHAALRGFANSKLSSSMILSAGMNPRLYSYIENFEDFYPNEEGEIRKKIVLKVSDFRSAFIQGKFLAKKGIWISEYRIESGLNCGGHAFASDGYLMGPILAEFRDRRQELVETLYETLKAALVAKGRTIPNAPLAIKVTAQGGVGTAEEHSFLIDQYNLDSVGWGTPFLLVPEATTVDDATLNKMALAKEKDLYLSNISPLGVPFHSLRGNTKDAEKRSFIDKGRPGSACPKKFVALNKEFTEKGICTASRQYQHLKLNEILNLDISDEAKASMNAQVIEKSCTCVGLGTSALLAYNLDTKVEGEGVSVCPGPNMAYFSKRMKLKEIIDHIYGRKDVPISEDRPHMFVKELSIYIEYLSSKITEAHHTLTKKQEKYLMNFAENLSGGISYYKTLFSTLKEDALSNGNAILSEFDEGLNRILSLKLELSQLAIVDK